MSSMSCSPASPGRLGARLHRASPPGRALQRQGAGATMPRPLRRRNGASCPSFSLHSRASRPSACTCPRTCVAATRATSRGGSCARSWCVTSALSVPPPDSQCVCPPLLLRLPPRLPLAAPLPGRPRAAGPRRGHADHGARVRGARRPLPGRPGERRVGDGGAGQGRPRSEALVEEYASSHHCRDLLPPFPSSSSSLPHHPPLSAGQHLCQSGALCARPQRALRGVPAEAGARREGALPRGAVADGRGAAQRRRTPLRC